MATVRDKNVKKRVKVSQVPTVPSDDILPIPNTMQKKMINSLPNEMLRYVFGKLEINKLIGIRGVCTRWQELAEDICREKRSILIESKAKNIPDPDLSASFNGLVDFGKNWIILKVKPIAKNRPNQIALSTDLCILLGKLFPQVENLVFNVTLQNTTDTADNLFTLLNNWSSSLVALCLNVSDGLTLTNFIVKSHYDQLFDHINNLTNLKRFAFYEHLESTYKLDFLTRLEHCTISTYYSDLLDTIPLLEENCTSLRLLQYVTLKVITLFPKLNAPLVKGLTHLGLIRFEHEVLSFICGNFGALQMLDINMWCRTFSADTISDLARLSKLSQLSIHYGQFDLPTLARSDLSILSSVQILVITNCVFRNVGQPFDADQFCQVLAFVFPNLQQLTIKHRFKWVRDEIAEHLDHFAYLRKHVIASD